MYQFTQVQFVKRKDYYDVIVYYSKNGEKFRPSTGIRVLPKHLLDSGGISSKHPNYDTDILIIKSMQDKIESLVLSYKTKYGEKPPVEWLENEFGKNYSEAKKDLKHILSYWEDFIKEKKQTSRSEGSINRYGNLADTLEKFKKKKNYVLDFNILDQQFFNDFFFYMVSEHEYVRNKHQKTPESGITPEIGISNETAIKRVKDFIEYLKYCVVEHDVDIKLEKIKKYIKLAKHKIEIKPLSNSQKWELTFTLDELNFFINLDYYVPDFYESLSENKRRYLDILFFMCLQGTAPTDAKSIKRTDIKDGRIIKERNKNEQCEKI